MKWKKTHTQKRQTPSSGENNKKKKDLELSTRLTAEAGNAVQQNDNENR